MFDRLCAPWIFVFLLTLALLPTANAQLYPQMSHVWMLHKSSWGGACAGKSTHFMTMDPVECQNALKLGYGGGADSCNPLKPFSADHYLSKDPFPGSESIFRLVKGGTCGNCKDTFVYTTNVSWKNELVASGWVHEKTYYGWKASNDANWYKQWGLVPIYHGYHAGMCDNYYSEHGYKVADVYNNKGYTTGHPTEPLTTGIESTWSKPMSVAYTGADGYVDLTVQCSGVSNCSWTLTGPGGWSIDATGTKSYSKLPTHIYKLVCNPVAGMNVTSSTPTQGTSLSYFGQYVLTCAYTCNNQCSAGQTQCEGATAVKNCTTNSQGCWVWGSVQECNDSKVCTTDSCSAGSCKYTNNTNACNDGDPCTIGDFCSGGQCQPGSPMNCNDGIFCTTDSCSGGSCQFVHNSNACNDNDPCTTGDQCTGGTCKGTPIVCNDNKECTNDSCSGGSCQFVNNSNACNDNNPCTSGDQCSLGSCKGTPIDCNDNNPCTNDSCSGGCQNIHNTNVCNDNDPCTSGDKCSNGNCAGTAMVCNDTNPCTNDACLGGMCQFMPNAAPCDDGNMCTTGDTCGGGTCQPGAATVPAQCNDGIDCTLDGCQKGVGCTHTPQNAQCNDNNPCTDDQCSGGCKYTNNTKTCDDNDPCTLGDKCSTGNCAGTAMVCNDNNPCTNDICAGGICQFVPNAAPCDDNNPCTSGDVCAAGTCQPGALVLPPECNDGIDCTLDGCQKGGGCTHTPQHTKCGDDNPCTDDVCDLAVGCLNIVTAGLACSDGNPCTAPDTCKEGVCVSGPLDLCDDQIACTLDSCDVTAGCVHEAKNDKCADNIACTVDVCVAAKGCEHTPNPEVCSDNNPCTEDVCDIQAGCVYADGAAELCNDKNPCTQDLCTPATGCAYEPLDSVGCDDGDPCTVKDVCVSGICKPGGAKCNDGNPCTADACDQKTGNCVNSPMDGVCDDGDICTESDQCVQGKCVGTQPKKCTDGNACTEDSCDAKDGCVYTPNGAACSDGNPCTEGDQCKEGGCVPGEIKVCNDDNPCTEDSCGPAGNCAFTPTLTPTPCNDGNPCTKDDACNGGKCAGVQTPDCCSSAVDCINPQPGCLSVTCKGGICDTQVVCAKGACGPNPCDETVDCGACFAFEACVSGMCYETCSPTEKDVTRCADDGKVLEKCAKDESTGVLYWKSTDCVALGEAGCAFSKDKNLYVCCTPNCEGKQCGLPSACGVPCGHCGDGEYCCEPGMPCATVASKLEFQCTDCCADQECGASLVPGCSAFCGTCGDGKACKQGTCVGTCEEQNISAEGHCVGAVAWWCEQGATQTFVQSEDCAQYAGTCCYVEALSHVGCCDCEGECDAKGWECGKDSCGLPCGEHEGGCAVGFTCIPSTHQCKCDVPALCYPDAGATEDTTTETSDTNGSGGNGATETSDGDADDTGGSTEGVPDDGCSCRIGAERPLAGDVLLWLWVAAFLMVHGRHVKQSAQR